MIFLSLLQAIQSLWLVFGRWHVLFSKGKTTILFKIRRDFSQPPKTKVNLFTKIRKKTLHYWLFVFLFDYIVRVLGIVLQPT